MPDTAMKGRFSMQTKTKFDKETFLREVMYSLAVTLNYSPIYGMREFLSWHKSLRETYLPEFVAHLTDSRVICSVKRIGGQFYWKIEPHYDEILSWHDPNKVRPVRAAINRFHRIPEQVMCISLPTLRPDDARYILPAIIIFSEILALADPEEVARVKTYSHN